MEKFEDFLVAVKLTATGIAGVITAVLGWMGWLVLIWVGCMAGDYITGTAAAVKTGTWSSGKARDGLWHKAGMFFAVIAAAVADSLILLLANNIPAISLPWTGSLILPLVLCWYIVTELGSILENSVKLGAPVPAFLTKALDIVKDKVEGHADEE